MAIADILTQRAEGARVRDPSHPRISPLTVETLLVRRPSAVCCVDAGTEACAALRLMAERDLAAVLVTVRGELAGVFSEREYRNAAVLEPAGSVTVGEAMIACEVALSPEDSARHCTGMFAEHGLCYLPVKRGTELIDVLSLEELLGALADHYRNIILAIELDQQVMFLRGTFSC